MASELAIAVRRLIYDATTVIGERQRSSYQNLYQMPCSVLDSNL